MDRKTFKEMRFLKKLEWIIQYYGVTIVVVIISLYVGFLFLKSVLGPGDGYELRVMILDDYCSKESASAFSDELTERTGVPCEVATYFKSIDTQLQAFSVRLFSDDIDVIIAPQEQMEQIVKNGYLAEARMLEDGMTYYSATDPEGQAEDRETVFIGYQSEKAMNEHVPEVVEYFTALTP